MQITAQHAFTSGLRATHFAVYRKNIRPALIIQLLKLHFIPSLKTPNAPSPRWDRTETTYLAAGCNNDHLCRSETSGGLSMSANKNNTPRQRNYACPFEHNMGENMRCVRAGVTVVSCGGGSLVCVRSTEECVLVCVCLCACVLG